MTPKSQRWHFGSFSGKFRGAPMRASALLPAALLAVLIASACSNQGEGEFCDNANGDSDCASGLTCQAAPGIPGNALVASRYRCCPTDLSQATTAVCMQATTNVIDSGIGVPDADELGLPDAEAGAAETGAAEAGASDATIDAAPEAGPAPDAATTDGAPE